MKKAKKNKPTDYTAIRLWGLALRSYDYYIERVQAEAAEENAPLNAIYKDSEEKWVCVSDLDPENPFRKDYAEYARAMRWQDSKAKPR